MCWEAGVLAVLLRRQQGESPSTSQSAHSWVPIVQKRNTVAREVSEPLSLPPKSWWCTVNGASIACADKKKVNDSEES